MRAVGLHLPCKQDTAALPAPPNHPEACEDGQPRTCIVTRVASCSMADVHRPQVCDVAAATCRPLLEQQQHQASPRLDKFLLTRYCFFVSL